MTMVRSREPNVMLRRLLLAVVILVLLGGLPFFVQIAGFQFLPSTNWVANSLWLALASGAVAAIFLSVIIIRGRKRDGLNRRAVGYLFLIAFSPLFFGALGTSAVFSGGPLVYTAIFGKPAELSYKVKRAGSSGRKCRNKIDLIGLPILNDRLCGFPKDFVDSLRPGQTIVVAGKGSPFGIFVDTARLSDEP
ncbi:MAG: hypothetical protein EAZ40_16760 [Rhodobacterales bacterium]|nr:MAG: hypothetical protein EAZ40_16760 [Rhodobacterales bacterium]